MRRVALYGYVIGVLLILGSFSSLPAQDTSRLQGGWGYLSISGNYLILDNFNTLFEEQGYDPLPNQYLGYGAGGWGLMKNFIIGGEGHLFRSRGYKNDDYRVSLTGGYGTFNLGYIFWHSQKWMSYFYMGVGEGQLSVQITPDNPSLKVKDILQRPQQSARLSQRSYLFVPTFGITYRSDNIGSLVIGGQVGMMYSYMHRKWRLHNVVLNDSPGMGIKGPFLRLTIGGGKF